MVICLKMVLSGLKIPLVRLSLMKTFIKNYTKWFLKKERMKFKKSKRLISNHCVKSIRIWSYSSPYFPALTLNTDQNNSEYGHILRSELV